MTTTITEERHALLTGLYEWAKTQGNLGVAVVFVRQFEADSLSQAVITNAIRVRDRQTADRAAVTVTSTEVKQDGSISPANPWPGIYTVETPSRHYTFKVAIQDSDAEWAPGATVVSYLAGRDNTSDYVRFATVRNGRLYSFHKFRTPGSADLLAAADQFLDDPDEALEAKHCARCGRVLTTPESVRQGFGPECVKMGLR